LGFIRGGVRELKGRLIPSSVHTLILRTDEDVACAFSSKSLKSLTVQGPFLIFEENEVPKSFGKQFDLENWATVEDISIYSGLVAWNKFSLLFLRTIYLNKLEGRGHIDTDITSFIKDIACRPDSYPPLEEIGLAECPELDILMIILERRNILQGLRSAKSVEFALRLHAHSRSGKLSAHR
jgi:hypothetical protein